MASEMRAFLVRVSKTLTALICSGLASLGALGAEAQDAAGADDYVWVWRQVDVVRHHDRAAVAERKFLPLPETGLFAEVDYVMQSRESDVFEITQNRFNATAEDYRSRQPPAGGRYWNATARARFTGIPAYVLPDQTDIELALWLGQSGADTRYFAEATARATLCPPDQSVWDGDGGHANFRAEDGSTWFRQPPNSFPKKYALTAPVTPGVQMGDRVGLCVGLSWHGVTIGMTHVYEWQPVPASSITADAFVRDPDETPKPATEPEKEPSIWSEGPVPKDQYGNYKDSGARFSDMSGEVLIRPGDDRLAWEAADLDIVINVGDHIKTDEDSYVIVSMPDLSTYVMPPNTEIIMDTETPRESKIKLIAGKVWVNIKKMVEDGSMVVEMSEAAAGAKGTIFVAETHDGVSRIKVMEGAVALTGRTSGEVTVLAGQQAEARDGIVGGVMPFDIEAELDDWPDEVQGVMRDALAQALATGSGATVLPRFQPPSDWIPVDVHGLRFHVPPGYAEREEKSLGEHGALAMLAYKGPEPQQVLGVSALVTNSLTADEAVEKTFENAFNMPVSDAEKLTDGKVLIDNVPMRWREYRLSMKDKPDEPVYFVAISSQKLRTSFGFSLMFVLVGDPIKDIRQIVGTLRLGDLAAEAKAAEKPRSQTVNVQGASYLLPEGWSAVADTADTKYFKSADGRWTVLSFWWWPDEPVTGHGNDTLVEHVIIDEEPVTRIWAVYPEMRTVRNVTDRARADGRRFIFTLEGNGVSTEDLEAMYARLLSGLRLKGAFD